MKDGIKHLKQKIETHIVSFSERSIKVDGIFFSTEDGFIIRTFLNNDISIEPDNIAAIISSLFGVCSAGGQEIEGSSARNVIVEYDKYILLLMNFKFESSTYLMAIMSDKNNNNLAQIIFTGNDFVKAITSTA